MQRRYKKQRSRVMQNMQRRYKKQRSRVMVLKNKTRRCHAVFNVGLCGTWLYIAGIVSL